MAIRSLERLGGRIDAMLKGKPDPTELGFRSVGDLIQFEIEQLESRVRDLEKRQRHGEME